MVDLRLGQGQEVAFVGLVALGGLLGEAVVVGGDGGQLEPLKVALQQEVGFHRHDRESRRLYWERSRTGTLRLSS